MASEEVAPPPFELDEEGVPVDVRCYKEKSYWDFRFKVGPLLRNAAHPGPSACAPRSCTPALEGKAVRIGGQSCLCVFARP